MQTWRAAACAWLLAAAVVCAGLPVGGLGHAAIRQGSGELQVGAGRIGGLENAAIRQGSGELQVGAGRMEQCEATPDVSDRNYECKGCITNSGCPESCCSERLRYADMGGEGAPNAKALQYIFCTMGGCCTRVVSNGKNEVFVSERVSATGRDQVGACTGYENSESCPLCASSFEWQIAVECPNRVDVPSKSEPLAAEISECLAVNPPESDAGVGAVLANADESNSDESNSDESNSDESNSDESNSDESNSGESNSDESNAQAEPADEAYSAPEDASVATEKPSSHEAPVDDEDSSSDEKSSGVVEASMGSRREPGMKSVGGDKNGLSKGAKVGIGFAAVVALILLGLLLCCLCTRWCPCSGLKRKILWGVTLPPSDSKFSLKAATAADKKRADLEDDNLDGVRLQETAHGQVVPSYFAGSGGNVSDEESGDHGEYVGRTLSNSDYLMTTPSDSSDGSDYEDLDDIVPHNWDDEDPAPAPAAEAGANGTGSPFPTRHSAVNTSMSAIMPFADPPLTRVRSFREDPRQQEGGDSFGSEDGTWQPNEQLNKRPPITALPQAGGDRTATHWLSFLQPSLLEDDFGNDEYVGSELSSDGRSVGGASPLPVHNKSREFMSDSHSAEECDVTPQPVPFGRQLSESTLASVGDGIDNDDSSFYF